MDQSDPCPSSSDNEAPLLINKADHNKRVEKKVNISIKCHVYFFSSLINKHHFKKNTHTHKKLIQNKKKTNKKKIYLKKHFFTMIILSSINCKSNEDIHIKTSQNLWGKCLSEIKSTFHLEDWVASYLGVLGTALIIIIYAIDKNISEINLPAWHQTPGNCFAQASVWIVMIFAYGIVWV
jgi:hypothetical protein